MVKVFQLRLGFVLGYRAGARVKMVEEAVGLVRQVIKVTARRMAVRRLLRSLSQELDWLLVLETKRGLDIRMSFGPRGWVEVAVEREEVTSSLVRRAAWAVAKRLGEQEQVVELELPLHLQEEVARLVGGVVTE